MRVLELADDEIPHYEDNLEGVDPTRQSIPSALRRALRRIEADSERISNLLKLLDTAETVLYDNGCGQGGHSESCLGCSVILQSGHYAQTMRSP